MIKPLIDNEFTHTFFHAINFKQIFMIKYLA